MQPQAFTDAPPTENLRARVRERLGQIQASKRLWPFDFPAFARDALVIRPKTGAPRPFELNSVQRKLDALLDNQKAETGKVRAIIVKARQLGISTYVGGRLYHRSKYQPGYRANIMTHRDDATRNLMGMVKRFHEHDSEAPGVVFNNASELQFENDSGFSISTAGAVSTGAGRSFTFQLAHLSELALWQNAADHLTAVLDAVPDADGSEVIIESTAQGTGGPFHSMTMAAQQGEGSYQLIFLPWFEHDEYQTDPPDGWTPGRAVRDLLERHDLTPAQLYWAEQKNAERAQLDGSDSDELCWRFRQEYPSTVDEAFRASRQGGYIPASIVAAARVRENPHQAEMPLIIGCDFATGGGGTDSEQITAEQLSGKISEGGSEDGDWNFFISHRGRVKGREVHERFKDQNSVSVANKLASIIDERRPARVFMDKGGGGAAVYDILAGRGYARAMELVDFGSSARPVDQRKYRNKRAEMHGDFREWLQDGDIPDDDLLETEITAPWIKREDESGLLLAPKREIRQKLKLSPDGLDACILCHAGTVRPNMGEIRVGGAG